ncbi:tectonic-1 [Anabrus simplex]|uniref:tectonic-1 n=1 Tax=Anabrus simplex TaxID=316456 RepID=UPI0035A37832
MLTIGLKIILLFALTDIYLCASRNCPINWKVAGEKGSSFKEREYLHPAFNEVAVAPCDLTKEFCDIHCCQDEDCSEEQMNSFWCLDDSDHLPHYLSCGLNTVTGVEWSPFLCLIYSNSPYLGQYFITPKKIKTERDLKKSLSHKGFNYEVHIGEKVDSSSSEEYKFGVPIKAKFYSYLNLEDDHTYLQLPTNYFHLGGGFCVDSSPVRYLVNTDAYCIRRMTPESCTTNSLLSALTFAVGDTRKNYSSLYQLPFIKRDSSGIDLVDTNVKLYCVKKGSDYLTLGQNIFIKLDSSMNLTSLNDRLEYNECEGINQDYLQTSFNESTGICYNVLVSVSHNFYWSSKDLVKLETSYVIADVPVTLEAFIGAQGNTYLLNPHVFNQNPSHFSQKADIFVTQHFSSTFRQFKSNFSDENNVTNEDYEPVQRSGNPGYNIGLPIFITTTDNETDADHEEYNILQVWKSADRTKLPPYIVLKRKTLSKNLPASVIIRSQNSGWMESSLVEDWVKCIWQRCPGSLLGRKRFFVTDTVKKHIKDGKTDLAVIPGGMTSMLQPLMSAGTVHLKQP